LKPLLTMIRNLIVGLCWSIFFVEGVRVIMLRNWNFDIFNSGHWNYAWELWLRGVVIRSPKEWAFILILITFIPLLLTGWVALCLLPWDEIFKTVFGFPFKLFGKVFSKQVTAIKHTASIKAVKKKKSYKEVRPRALRAPLDESVYNNTTENQPAPITDKTPTAPVSVPAPIPPVHVPFKASSPATPSVLPAPSTEKFDHSLFQFDEDDDFDFNFDAFDEKETPKIETPSVSNEKNIPAPKAKVKEPNPKNNNKKNPDKSQNNKNQPANKNNDNNKQRSGNSVHDVLRQKGFEVIVSATIKGNLIDFIGVSEDKICLCLVDKENGDWLADEERFNDEEPLWFSESSHRISPVRKVDIAKQALEEKIKDSDLDFEIIPYVVVPSGNIINAEDMFEIWDNMHINVTRIDRGTPKELKLFSKSLPEVNAAVDKDNFEKIKKLVRNIT